MSIRVRTFAAGFAACVLLSHAAHAQQLPMSDRQKGEIAQQKAFEKSTDQAYQAEMKRTRDVKRKSVDPWANVRAPQAGSGN